MSNTNNIMQTQTLNGLHNVIIEAGGEDRPPMLALDKDVPVTEGSSETTVDACPNTCEMWKAIERLKQGESINVQDLETNLYWEFRKFTSHDEWQRFMTLVKQSQELKTVSYHKLYDILKQHQNEVNEIRAERLARTANPLTLVAQQQPVYHPQNHPTHYTQNSSTRSQQVATRNRGKAIINSSPPIYDQKPYMVAEDDEISKDQEIDKLMALISLSFKKIYKPTNNNLRTSSNTSRANQDNYLRITRGTGYDNQKIVNVDGARETVGTTVVQKSGIQCYNYKEYGHVARECQKPKRVKDAAYHKEKMLLCNQEEAGFQLNAEQADLKDDTDDEPEDQELKAHYIEQIDQNDDDDLANERDLLASLNEKLKCEIDDSKNRNKFLETSKQALVDKLKGVVQPVTPTSAKQKLARKNELKARGYREAFWLNTKTKKVQKTLLKQQFENFSGSSSEGLDQIHDRLQKLVSQLEIHGVSLSKEDVNLKFLRSLPSEWKTHTLIWRNKTDLEDK
nr:hypothetical protein [Tanacetum cinerariifolium]